MVKDGARLESLKKEIMVDIYTNRILLTSERDRPEGWRVVSGLWSPFYIQLRNLSSFPETMRKVGEAMTIMIKEAAPTVDKLVGIAFSGIPIATAISIESGLPACHTRKMLGVKTEADLERALADYGQHSILEGVLKDGDALCLVDDLVTGMESKMIARSQVLAEASKRELSDVSCNDVAVIIDRQQGAMKRASEVGLRLHSLIQLVDEGLAFIKPLMSKSEYELVSGYLADPSKYQNRP
jgi:orotate phosphoribosyltransferase